MSTSTSRYPDLGEVAPDFTLKNEEGQEVTLSSFRGKKNVVLAFYPFDWSPVCTKENCAITEDLSKFGGREAEIFGVSCDSFFSHKAWKEKLGLAHSLLSDQSREVSKKYGLYLEELNCSKRATVVVDGVVPSDNAQFVNVGGEYIFSEFLSLRAGYRALFLEESEEGFTFGGGLKHKLFGETTLQFDYSYGDFGLLDNVQEFALSIYF